MHQLGRAQVEAISLAVARDNSVDACCGLLFFGGWPPTFLDRLVYSIQVRGDVPREFTLGPIDEMHLAVSPALLGEGEHFFSGLDLPKFGYVPRITASGEGTLHVVIRKT